MKTKSGEYRTDRPMQRLHSLMRSPGKQRKTRLPPAPSGTAKVPERETRRVYRVAEDGEYQSYLNARFDKASSGHNSFSWQERRWRYEHSDFDERGDFDLLLAAAPPT